MAFHYHLLYICQFIRLVSLYRGYRKSGLLYGSFTSSCLEIPQSVPVFPRCPVNIWISTTCSCSIEPFSGRSEAKRWEVVVSKAVSKLELPTSVSSHRKEISSWAHTHARLEVSHFDPYGLDPHRLCHCFDRHPG
jgi:hypothetical protein